MSIQESDIIKAVTERMAKRRQDESGIKGKNSATICYAVSVKTGKCYVGYNLDELSKTSDGTGKCAENRATYVAASYKEKLEDLVFFALNDKSEFFNACRGCQRWLWNGRGFLKNSYQTWIISTVKPDPSSSPPTWNINPLTEQEKAVLLGAGESSISDASNDYFSKITFG